MEKPLVNKKPKSKDTYEQLAEEIRLLTMNNADAERQVRLPQFEIS